MTELISNGYVLKNLGKINILLGKNGCGKSTVLQNIVSDNKSFLAKYITPERGGKLAYNPNIDQTIQNVNTLEVLRRKNQAINFKEQTIAQFKKLETMVLRKLESVVSDAIVKNNPFDNEALKKNTFDAYVEKINSLLDHIEIHRTDMAFDIRDKKTKEKIAPDKISSGESELITLGIESLIFAIENETETTKKKYLLPDELDVHLHADLQIRLMSFIKKLAEEYGFCIITATHSTAVLSALESYNDIKVCFMYNREKELEFESIDEVFSNILPIFGTHPLSNVFNEKPIFLVEGDDDERIWDRAVRSSDKKIKLYPCSTGAKSEIKKYEQKVIKLAKAVYDKPKAFSLRDGDDAIGEELEDDDFIIRMRLNCRAAENLILTDEVLAFLDTSWDKLRESIEAWLNNNKNHKHFNDMQVFKNGVKDSNIKPYDRQRSNLKNIRNDLMSIIGSNKDWEIAVGASIGKLVRENLLPENFSNVKENSLLHFLGEKVFNNLFAD